MPQLTCQKVNKGPGPLVRMSSFSREDKHEVTSMVHFVFREFMHWKKDLQNRKKQGKYYLDLLSYLELSAAEPTKSSAFIQLLHFEIPALYSTIEKWNSASSDLNIEVIRSVQKNYFQLCKRYDRIKRQALGPLETGRRFEIY